MLFLLSLSLGCYVLQLLQNLEYSEAVAIHLVHNGQEMMECDEWNLARILG